MKNTSYSEEISNQVQEFQNGNLENNEVSSFKILASQFVAVFPLIFMKLRFGMGIGFTTLLIPELSKNSTEINVTLDELTWFSSYCFIVPVAAVSGGFLAQYIGARRLLIFSYIVHISADLLFHWADSATMILVAQTFVGFSGGLSKGPGYTYIAEILQPKFRSVTMAALNLLVLLGWFSSLFLGNFMYWRTQTFISLVVAAIGFTFIHFVPESPLWLASKNRFQDAEKSLARLRGWTTPENVKAELYSSVSLSDPIKNAPAEDSNFSKGNRLREGLSLFFDRMFYVPLLTMTALFFFAEFDGAQGLTIYSAIIFEEIKSPLDFYVGSTIISALSLVAAIIYICSVPFLGKRILALASVFSEVICLSITVTLLYLTKHNLIASGIYSWVILIALMSTAFAHNFGLGKIIYFLNSELYPQKLRYVGTGVGYFINEIMCAIFNKSFLYIVKAITYPGTLMIFIVVNVVSFIVIYLILPETEAVTLREIEEHYKEKKTLKNEQ